MFDFGIVKVESRFGGSEWNVDFGGMGMAVVKKSGTWNLRTPYGKLHFLPAHLRFHVVNGRHLAADAKGEGK